LYRFEIIDVVAGDNVFDGNVEHDSDAEQAGSGSDDDASHDEKLAIDCENDEVDWEAADRAAERFRRNESNRSRKKRERQSYNVVLFGVDPLGRSVSCHVLGFRPYFYVQVPPHWSKSQIRTRVFQPMLQKLRVSARTIGMSSDILYDSVLMGFDNGKKYPFVKLDFPSMAMYRRAKSLFLDANDEPIRHDGAVAFETNLDPMFRLFHKTDVPPAAWVELRPRSYKVETRNTMTRCQIAIETKSDALAPFETTELAPKIEMSWDIECTSSHGDFPQANKTWRKPAVELYELLSGEKDQAERADRARKYVTAAALREKGPLSTIHVRPEIVTPADKLAFQLTVALWQVPDRIWGDNVDREEAVRLLSNSLNRAIRSTPPMRLPGPAVPMPMDTPMATLAQMALAAKKPAPPGQAFRLYPQRQRKITGDPIIQIGAVVSQQGRPVQQYILTLGTCAPIPGKHVICCETEKELLCKWAQFVNLIDPDTMIGHNIFGFDERYLYLRAKELGCLAEFTTFGRLTAQPIELEERRLASSAMGDNRMYKLSVLGRVQVDLLTYVRRAYPNLDSYKLDALAAQYINDKVVSIQPLPQADGEGQFEIVCKDASGLRPGNYLVLIDSEADFYQDGAKFRVESITPIAETKQQRIVCAGTLEAGYNSPPIQKWAAGKDDVSPKDIFRLFEGTADDRARIAKYCVQDCQLVLDLYEKLAVFNNSMAMANVCWVPLSCIFMRGVGVRIESFMFYECDKIGQRIPVLKKPEQNGPSDGKKPWEMDSDEEGDDAEGDEEEPAARGGGGDDAPDNLDNWYEGAIVLEPRKGLYLDDPVAVVDFASLYPSSEISEMISHDRHVCSRLYDLDGNLKETVDVFGNPIPGGVPKYDNIAGVRYVDIPYDMYEIDPTDKRKHPRKLRVGVRVDRWAQVPGATVPRILQQLLAARKRTRKLAAQFVDSDPFKAGLLEAAQLAYKTVANSLYGQMGSRTFKIRCMQVAASTTAYGRRQIMFTCDMIQHVYGGGRDPRCDAVIVYGDTDSVFVMFQPKDAAGNVLKGEAAMKPSQALANEAGKLVSSFLKPPQDLEFDKIMHPFALFNKKRYVGVLYEQDDRTGELLNRGMKSMGLALKRRDNAPIVKVVLGGAVNRIMKRDLIGSIQFVRDKCQELIDGRIPLHKLTVTKSLRPEYKTNPPAHKILADRVADRDPGNKFSSSDRVPYVYVDKRPKPKLQGHRIETPQYVREHKLPVDYAHYLTDQIANPVGQLYALALETMPEYKRYAARESWPTGYWERRIAQAEKEHANDKHYEFLDKALKAIDKQRAKVASNILFESVLRTVTNRNNRQPTIKGFFQATAA
jgi:DNA polymerase elongation subunit (family B)